jgi:hypothetical protein
VVTPTSIKWVDRALVVSPYRIGLCTSEFKFKKELQRLKVPVKDYPVWIYPNANATVHYLEGTKNHDQCCIVCIDRSSGRAASEIVGLLIHEAVHIWQSTRDELREDHPSQEFEAYSIQTIAQRLIEAYGNYSMKKKVKK